MNGKNRITVLVWVLATLFAAIPTFSNGPLCLGVVVDGRGTDTERESRRMALEILLSSVRSGDQVWVETRGPDLFSGLRVRRGVALSCERSPDAGLADAGAHTAANLCRGSSRSRPVFFVVIADRTSPSLDAAAVCGLPARTHLRLVGVRAGSVLSSFAARAPWKFDLQEADDTNLGASSAEVAAALDRSRPLLPGPVTAFVLLTSLISALLVALLGLRARHRKLVVMVEALGGDYEIYPLLDGDRIGVRSYEILRTAEQVEVRGPTGASITQLVRRGAQLDLASEKDCLRLHVI